MSTATLEKPDHDQQLLINTTVAMYATHAEAEAAVKSLQKSGFDMKKLSIVGKDYHTEEHVVGYYNTGDRMLAWGKQGAFWGGIWGLLFGGAFFLIPGVGPVLMAGPLISGIVGALEGAVILGGLSVLGAALVSQGIPKDSAIEYETEVSGGKFLLVVRGTPNELIGAKTLLELTDHLGIQEHSS
ncbi:MAG: general stress protein [Chthonomonadales bacterium]